MTTLVTGATGFLGQALLAPLAAKDRVVALHRLESKPIATDGVTWVAQNLAAPLRDDLPAAVDVVVHLAQSRRYRDFPDGATDVFEVNAGSALRLLDYARRAGASCVVLASSGAVYAPSPEPIREDAPTAPPSLYATCKLSTEAITRHYTDFFSVQLLRYFFIYGPGQCDMFIPGLVDRVRRRLPVTLRDDTGIHVNPLFVSDAVTATLAATNLSDSGIYNIAGPEVVSLRELATVIGQQLGTAPVFERTDVGTDLVADISRMRSRLGGPVVETREGIARTIAGDPSIASPD
jgi:nucleoside-diphosphate-sugar epimerase